VSVARAAGTTDTGRRRRHNEDSYVLRSPLFAVADGMGGAQAGEVASRLAATTLAEFDAGGDGEERIVNLVQEANRRVHTASTEDSARAGMGTTTTVALVGENTVTIGHVGDSRAYRLRNGELEQLTDDHTLVAELMRSGKLSAEEARIHPQRSVITRALGADPDVDVDVFTLETQDGDVFLLCSDGLSSMVEDDEIEASLEAHLDNLDAAVDELIQKALIGGGEDNITVVVFAIGEPRDEPDDLERTREHAVPQKADDDTLDESDGVRTFGDTTVMRVPDIEAAAAVDPPTAAVDPPMQQRRGVLAPALLILLVALIVVLAVWGLTR
jgi:serine/threonine protein phosphatase PrpC